jgi:hypothetical protein
MKKRAIMGLAAAVTLLGGAKLNSTAVMQQKRCANSAAGYDCTAGTALSWCQGYFYDVAECTVTGAHCSSTGNYNCEVSAD